MCTTASPSFSQVTDQKTEAQNGVTLGSSTIHWLIPMVLKQPHFLLWRVRVPRELAQEGTLRTCPRLSSLTQQGAKSYKQSQDLVERNSWMVA